MENDLVLRLQMLAAMLGDPRPRATVSDAIAEIERLRGIVPDVLERLNDELCEENERLRAALTELTRMDPPETESANVRVVVYGNDARDFALRALGPND